MCSRNENFKGQVSVIGHSLGSLIMFDILSHQMSEGFGQPDPKVDNAETTIVPTECHTQNANPNPTLEEVNFNHWQRARELLYLSVRQSLLN